MRYQRCGPPLLGCSASYAGARAHARNPPARTLPEQRYRRLLSRKRCKERRFQVAGVKETMISGVWLNAVLGASSQRGLPSDILLAAAPSPASAGKVRPATLR